MQLGVSYIQARRYEPAIVCFKKVVELKPNDVNAICDMAIANKLSGNMDSAKKYEQLAQKYNPNFKL